MSARRGPKEVFADKFAVVDMLEAVKTNGVGKSRYLTLKLVTAQHGVDWQAIILGCILSFVSAYACIHYFLILLDKLGMMPFVIYRLLLGFGLLWFVYV